MDCMCIARGKPAHIDCLKKYCPDNWEQIRNEEIDTCTNTYRVDLSDNATCTGISIPTQSWSYGNFSYNPRGGLSQSDKIAIGVGVGFGVPTILIGLGAWLFARRRRGVDIRMSLIGRMLESQKREA
ncbi:hypothetical protein GP486_007683 [Trichoglossum hirsutum]|uniref:Uncharacterized protein n=1 Tax=Trichoglossum hirsutum TaxID=265104 RepID=A0A9P8IFF0_9PEZI|nr:hypothetical protein GP486_007683 [Trichoglossum hirsutum]